MYVYIIVWCTMCYVQHYVQSIYIYVMYTHTCVVLCRHIYNRYMYCTLESHMSCDGPWPFVWEKITFSCSVRSSYSAVQVNCSWDLLCDHQQQQQGAITSCYIVLLCTTVVYTSVQQLQDPPSLIRCTIYAWNILSEFWRHLINCIM
jgi:hypothetical protein